MKWIIALIFYGLTSLQAAQSEEIDLNIGTHKIRTSIANTPQSRAQGLMNRTFLCPNCGMLFVFPHSGNHKFWMKNTPLPLAIAFISSKGHILQISEMQKHTLHNYSAQEDILYALEMNAGWFAAHQIKTGERIEGLNQASAAE